MRTISKFTLLLNQALFLNPNPGGLLGYYSLTPDEIPFSQGGEWVKITSYFFVLKGLFACSVIHFSRSVGKSGCFS